MDRPVKRLFSITLASGLLLLVPLIAMQFTDEVQWTLFDFIVMGVLLFGSGLAYELLAGRGRTTLARAAAGVAVLSSLLLIWMNLAVGLIGNEDNPANLLYLGVLLIGLVGAFLANLQTQGMSRTLFAMAIAQFLVPVVALLIWRPSLADPPGIIGVFALNACFACLFAVSGVLFRRAHTPGAAQNETLHTL